MARVNSKRGSAKRTIKVDFTGVESRVTVPEGDYAVKVTEVKQEEGDKADYLAWKFEITDGKHEGSPLYLNTSLAEKALWNLRNLLMTLGVEVPNDELDIELDELPDLEMMAVVAHDTYEGKKQSKIVDFYPLEGGSDEKEEKEEKSSKRGKSKDEDEGKSSGRRGKDKEEEKSSKSGKGKKDDDEFEPITEAEVEDMDEDELADVVEKADLDIDLDELKSRRKKIAAVIEALEEKELIKEEKKSRR